MTEPPSCADVARVRQEPLHGTASRVRNWLMIEHDGEWGRDALLQSSLDPSLVQALKRMCDRYRIRPLLIRRRGERRCEEPSSFAAHSGTTNQWIQRLPLTALLDVDFGGMRRGIRPAIGDARQDPMYLVCTHDEHDPCCGRYGRSVADALSRSRPGAAWECSHVGGDRFAANLVCLPHGLYFGRVSTESATNIASLYERRLIDLDHYRGRSSYDPDVQAADIFIRRRERLVGIDDLVFESRRDHPGAESTIRFIDLGRSYREIRIAVRRAEQRRVTCHASRPGSPREYRSAFDTSSDATPNGTRSR